MFAIKHLLLGAALASLLGLSTGAARAGGYVTAGYTYAPSTYFAPAYTPAPIYYYNTPVYVPAPRVVYTTPVYATPAYCPPPVYYPPVTCREPVRIYTPYNDHDRDHDHHEVIRSRW